MEISDNGHGPQRQMDQHLADQPPTDQLLTGGSPADETPGYSEQTVTRPEPPQNAPDLLAVAPAGLPGNPELPADLRSPLRGMDLVFLVLFYFVTGTLFAFLVSLAAMFFFGVPRAALRDSATARASVVIISQILLSGASLLFLYAVVQSRGEPRFWPAVGWRSFQGVVPRSSVIMRCILGGFALAMAVGWLSHFFDRDMVLPMEELLRSRQSVLLLMFYGILIAPLFEETVFRGCLYPVLARKLGVGASVAITGILFGLAHSVQLWPAFGQIFLLVLVGLLLTYVRARTGTVVASYFIHLGYNTILFGGFYLATGGLHNLPS